MNTELFSRDIGVAEFENIEEMLERLDPSYPVFCLWPETLGARARKFVEGFPGRSLYAVKCNPHASVLDSLYHGGVRHFDTASLNEIASVAERFDDVNCYFNHPVKVRAHIESACKIYGVNDFVVDHPNELRKVLDIVPADAVIQVRLLVPSEHAIYEFSEKFGANEETAVKLLQAVETSGRKPAVSFHVGSQCIDVVSYEKALQLVAKVLSSADVTPEYINVGGGFPSYYREDVPPLDTYFSTITTTAKSLGLGGVEFLCEPGRALVADGCGLVVQVQHRADDALYINNGVYGCMIECTSRQTVSPARGLGRKRTLSKEMRDFRLFGPTCDPLDQFRYPFKLPADMEEGDWIELGVLGAYSVALDTRFNGFGVDTSVALRGRSTYDLDSNEHVAGRSGIAPQPDASTQLPLHPRVME